MRIDALAVQLRPRLMNEAADLGLRLVQAHARSVYASIAPVAAAIVLLALASAEVASWLPSLVIFWLKPWLDRSVLFVLSRAVFGTPTRWEDLWQARRQVWWDDLLATLTLRRLSPWRSFTQPARQLEGQSRREHRARRSQLLNGRRGAAVLMHTAFTHIEVVLVAACLALGYALTPVPWREPVIALFIGEPSLAVAMLLALPYAIVVMLLEPFYVGAGFAMYLNRRVELEAWDVEQELRRAFAPA